MKKFSFEIGPIHPISKEPPIFSEYKRIVEVSKSVSACPLTHHEVIELESIWNINRNQCLSRLKDCFIFLGIPLVKNNYEFSMYNILSLSFIGHSSITYTFDEYFIQGVLISKILKKWERMLSGMDSDSLRVIFIKIELLRILDLSQNNVTDELTVPIDMMAKLFWTIERSASEEQMLQHLNLLCELVEYLNSVELMENGTFIMKFHKSIDYNLEKFDIFNS